MKRHQEVSVEESSLRPYLWCVESLIKSQKSGLAAGLPQLKRPISPPPKNCCKLHARHSSYSQP